MRAPSQSSIQPVRDTATYTYAGQPSYTTKLPPPPSSSSFATIPIFSLESLDFFGRSSSERERERGDDQFPPGRISAFSGVEREDEVYSARQLAARDTEKAVKPEQPADPILVEPLLTTKLRLRVQVNNNNNNNNNNNKSNKSNLEEATLDGNEERFSLQPEIDSLDRAKPLTVTSSTFRAVDNKPRSRSRRATSRERSSSVAVLRSSSR